MLALMSGGGSALLSIPPAGMTLLDKIALNEALLRSGATILEMNAVRSWFSRIKGGRLAAAAAPARVVTLVISDVPSDDPSVVASGPTIPSCTSSRDIWEILRRYDIRLPSAARHLLDQPQRCVVPAVSGDVRMIATPGLALAAAARVARARDLTPLVLGDAIEGESRHVGTVMAGIARSVRVGRARLRGTPALLLSGGETTARPREVSGRGAQYQVF